MARPAAKPPCSDTQRQEWLNLYNGSVQTPSQHPTGFRDETEPVDETIESMATATELSHRLDDPKSYARSVSDHSESGAESKSQASEDGSTNREGGMVINAAEMDPNLLQSKRKKKKKRAKPASQRGLGKPTGFEEFHADVPLTPEQYAEEQELYTLELPFTDRILTAIQRFERTRKLSPHRRDVFYKYLAYGGVDIGPNMFQGVVNQKEMIKDDLAVALSQATISEEVKNDIDMYESKLSKFEIDFEGCMKGFLSRRANSLYEFDTKSKAEEVTTTLERFMDYLLQHDVCPEYEKDVLNTRDLCRKATDELWACSQAQKWLPGDFNMACSTLFGGKYSEVYDGQTYWGPEGTGEHVFVGFTAEKATQIVGFAIAGAASEQVYQEYFDITTQADGKELKVVEIIPDHGFEIIRIEDATEECKELYTTKSEEFRPVGRVYGKTWSNPEAANEDFTEAEKEYVRQASTATAANTEVQEYIFFIEAVILKHLSVGQKIQATIHRLNCGVWFFDEVRKIYPSFEVYLCDELMLGWKEPKPLKGSADYVENSDGNTDSGDEAASMAGKNGQSDVAAEVA